MKKKNKTLEIRHVNNYGNVGCGKVVPFLPRQKEKITILVPAGFPSDDQLAVFEVAGPSLSDLGIYDGDYLLVRRAFKRREITSDTICVVRILATDEMVAKRIHFSEGIVSLISTGGNIKERDFAPEDIEIQGIVFGVQRIVAPGGRFPRLGDEEIPE